MRSRSDVEAARMVKPRDGAAGLVRRLRGGHRYALGIRRIVRFGVIGVINTAVYYVLYLTLHLVLPFLYAHVIAFVLAMIGSYFLNCWVTFRIRPSWKTFLLFPLSNLANFVFTTVGLQVAVVMLHWDARWTPLPVAILAVPVTYVVAHYLILGRAHRKPETGDGTSPAHTTSKA